MLALPHRRSSDEVTLLAMANHLRAADPAKRPQRGHQIDCFKDIGLALRIVAEQEMKPRREIDIESRVIAEITEA